MKGRPLALALAALALAAVLVALARRGPRTLADAVLASQELDALLLRVEPLREARLEELEALLDAEDPGARDVAAVSVRYLARHGQADQTLGAGRLLPRVEGPPLLVALDEAMARLERNDLAGFEAGLAKAAKAPPLRTIEARLEAGRRLLERQGLVDEPERLWPWDDQGALTVHLQSGFTLSAAAWLAECRRRAGDDAGARRALAAYDAIVARLEPGSPLVGHLHAKVTVLTLVTRALLGEDVAARARAAAQADAAGAWVIDQVSLPDAESPLEVLDEEDDRRTWARRAERKAVLHRERLRPWMTLRLLGKAPLEPTAEQVASMRRAVARAVALERSATPAEVLATFDEVSSSHPPFATGLALRGLLARGRLEELPQHSSWTGALIVARACLGDAYDLKRALRLGAQDGDVPYGVDELAWALPRLPGGRERLLELSTGPLGGPTERVAVLVALEAGGR